MRPVLDFFPHSLAWRWRARQMRLRPSAQQILLYHSISKRRRDPLLLAVEPEVFEAQVRWLARECDLLSVHEWVTLAEQNKLPARAVALTFDDAYEDNFTQAAAVLKAAGATGVVFTAPELVDSHREPWWEELDALMLEERVLPGQLEVDGRRWLLESEPPPGRANWTVLQPAATLREKAFLEVSETIKRSDRASRDRRLEAIRSQLGSPGPVREGRRIAGLDLLTEAARSGVLEIGAHTRSHPCLSALTAADQSEEISGSRLDLARWLGSPPRYFAYPFGGYSDYGRDTADAVRRAGFQAAFANMSARPLSGRPSWEWPRLCVTGWSLEDLKQRLVP